MNSFTLELTTDRRDFETSLGKSVKRRQRGVCCVGSVISNGGITPFYSTHRLTDLSKKSKHILPCSAPTSIFYRLELYLKAQITQQNDSR